MADDRRSGSLLAGLHQIFPVSVHASQTADDEPTSAEDGGSSGRDLGYNLRRDRKRSFAEFEATDSDQYPYPDEDASPQHLAMWSMRQQPLGFSVLPDGKGVVKTRVRNWTHPETETLLTIWGDNNVQTQLKNSVHNNWIWERISALIKRRHPEFLPPRSAAQCKERLTYLRKQYRKAARLRARGKWPNVGNIQIYLDKLQSILGKRGKSSAASSSSKSLGGDAATNEARDPSTQASDEGMPTLPDVLESEDDEDDEDDEDEVELEEAEGDDIQDLFGQRQETDMDMSGEAAENNGSKSNDPLYVPSSRATKRPSTSAPPNAKKRGRPKANAPPRDDLTVAQAITDATTRYLDHQSYHLTEQTKVLQKYLKFERARMRWEMDMETRRMKWEEEREMREEERRQRQEELQAKRVADNREFMLQMAVILGNGPSKDDDATKN